MQVATPADPASARLGESVYRFVPRSIAGNLRDGIDMELARLKAKGHGIYSIHNRCSQHATLLCCVGVAVI